MDKPVEVSLCNCSFSSTSSNEAEFRKKAWLALAPLYEAGFLNSSLEYVMEANGEANDGEPKSVNTGEESVKKADYATTEASIGDCFKEREVGTLVCLPGAESNRGGESVKKSCFQNKTNEALIGYDCKRQEHENPNTSMEEQEKSALITGNQTEEQSIQLMKRLRYEGGKTHFNAFPCSAAVHLEKWWDDHVTYPYPTKEEKQELASASGLTEKQIKRWFAKHRHKVKVAKTNPLTTELPESIVARLQQWFDMNKSDTFPTEDQKLEIARAMRLTTGQVRKWLYYERARRKISNAARASRLEPPHHFPPLALARLKRWWEEHETHPYPTRQEKQELASATGLTVKQVNNWYVTRRHDTKVKVAKTNPLTTELPESTVSQLQRRFDMDVSEYTSNHSSTQRVGIDHESD